MRVLRRARKELERRTYRWDNQARWPVWVLRK